MKDENSGSSSDDEAYKEAVREAADNEYLKNLFLTNIPTDNGAKECDKTKSSSPRIKEPVEQFENFKLTASCREYIAKKLSNVLEKNIRLGNVWAEDKFVKSKKRKHGIKLLHSSKVNATHKISHEEYKSVKRKKETFNKDEEMLHTSRCKEVAVDADWILSKTETKAWAEMKKGTVFEYKKMKNGTLIEQVKPFVSQ